MGVSRSLAGRTGTWVSSVLEHEASVNPAWLPGSSVRLEKVSLDGLDFAAFYDEVSNGLLAALHLRLLDAAALVRFDAPQDAWAAYYQVNEAFSDRCDRQLSRNGQLFVHDYHLAFVPMMLRDRRPDARIAHFTHCPWAEPNDFAMLPERPALELLNGMLGADLISFYDERWRQNFLRCCDERGYPVDWRDGAVRSHSGRLVAVRAYPLGVDRKELRREAATASVRDHQHRLSGMVGACRLVVRVERMDRAKNLLQGLEAFELFLEMNPRAHGRVVHFALAYLARCHLPRCGPYASEVSKAAQAINDRFGRAGWQPVILETRPDYALGLAAMTLAHVLVVNSVRDGMNLVSKEGPSVNDRDCVLILSRQAGASDELAEGALLIDPLDTTELANALAAALDMPTAKRRARAAFLRRAAQALPPREWFDAQLRDLAAVGVPGPRRG